MKIDRELNEKHLQEEIEKKYEDFYFYKNYKNEERVQLKKGITDQMFSRVTEIGSQKHEKLMEERKCYQQAFIAEMVEKINLYKSKDR